MNKSYVLCGKMLSGMVVTGEQIYRKMFTSANKVSFWSWEMSVHMNLILCIVWNYIHALGDVMMAVETMF